MTFYPDGSRRAPAHIVARRTDARAQAHPLAVLRDARQDAARPRPRTGPPWLPARRDGSRHDERRLPPRRPPTVGRACVAPRRRALSLPKTNVGPLRYATDLFWTWQDNLRAIALGMDALRRVDRYGITRRGEQYSGFKALPPGSGAPSQGGMTRSDAAELLAAAASWGPLKYRASDIAASDEVRRTAFRTAARKAHPDAGGERSFWDSIELANRTLTESG